MLDSWVADGIVSPEQARRIAAAEAGSPDATPPRAARRSPLVEVLGYLGGSLVAAACAVAIGQYWSDLEDWVKVLLPALAAVALFGAGWATLRRDGDVPERLTAYLWFLGAVAAGGTAGVASTEFAHAAPETAFVWAGLTAGTTGWIAWRLAETSLQQISIFIGLLVAGGGVSTLLHVEPQYGGLAAWGLACMWATLGWGGLLRPTPTAYAIGAGVMLYGAQMFASTSERWPLLLGLTTTILLLAVSVRVSSGLFLGFGSVGVFLFVPQTMIRVFGDSVGAPVALFLAGAALLAWALLITWMQPRLRRNQARAPETPVPSERTEARKTTGQGPARMPRRLGSVVAGVGALSATLLIVGVVGRQAPPEYPDLHEHPDRSIPGRLAYIEPRTNDWCLNVVDASGVGPSHRLRCQKGWVEGVEWTEDDDIAFRAAEETGNESVVVDAETGEEISRSYSTPSKRPPISHNERPVFFDKEGKDAMIRVGVGVGVGVGDDQRQRETAKVLVRIKSPREYHFLEATWSPDGCWIGVVDSNQNLLIMASDGNPGLRSIVHDATMAAWEPREPSDAGSSCP